MSIELGNMITYNPLTVQVEDTLESILSRLPGMPFHHWPVVDDDHRLVGMLSEQDIVGALSQRFALAGTGGELETALPLTTRVSEIMTCELFTVSEFTMVSEALATMLQRQVHCLPVLNKGHLVAVLTSTDVLREFSYGELAICRETVNEHLTNCLDFLTPEATLAEAQAMLDAEHTDCLPVLQGTCPVGVITGRQLRATLLRQFLHEHAFNHCEESPSVLDSVLEAVLPLEPVRPGQKLSTAATEMVEHGAQAVAVVNQAKRLMGVITEENLLRLMLSDLERS